jgi:hypothetical protein
MGVSRIDTHHNALRGASRRWKVAQNTHLLACKLRFFATFRLALHSLIALLNNLQI